VSEFLNCDHSIGNFKAARFSVSFGVLFGFPYFQNNFFEFLFWILLRVKWLMRQEIT